MAGFATSRNLFMPKALCITGMAISVLLAILFLADLVGGKFFPAIAPFGGASYKSLMGVWFLLCAAALAYLSWATLREQ
jgi:hypothetical protein